MSQYSHVQGGICFKCGGTKVVPYRESVVKTKWYAVLNGKMMFSMVIPAKTPRGAISAMVKDAAHSIEHYGTKGLTMRAAMFAEFIAAPVVTKECPAEAVEFPVEVSFAEKARIAQEAAQEAEKAAKIAASHYTGVIGERTAFTLTAEYVHSFTGFYGITFITIFRDAENNTIVYKGSHIACKGDKVSLTATIKEHAVYNDVKQTIIARPKVKEISERA
jgi:hypothetical protein